MKQMVLILLSLTFLGITTASATLTDHGLNPTLIQFELKSHAIRNDDINKNNTRILLAFIDNTTHHDKLRQLSHQNDGAFGFDVAYTGTKNILIDYLNGAKLDKYTRGFLRSDLSQIIYVCTHKP